MGAAVDLVEVWRGDIVESVHRGHAVVCDAHGRIVEAWGDPDAIILPRSACKMVQALPLVETGAADRAGLTPEHLALACASHQGGQIHVARVTRWLADLGLDETALRCGPQLPNDREMRTCLICGDSAPDQRHNNCSGKHSGFLTLSRDLGAGPEYLEIDHPVQVAVRAAFEEVTGEASPSWAIDGCSAPNFATSMTGLARAMAAFAGARADGDGRARAMVRLRDAMMAHPELVAGTGRACTELMQAMEGRAAIKTGAEAVFCAILPGPGLGIAVKIADGGTRGSEALITALLSRHGALDPTHPSALKRLGGPVRNRAGLETGVVRVVAGLQ